MLTRMRVLGLNACRAPARELQEENARSTATSLQLSLATWLCALPGAYAIIAPFTMLIPEHAFDTSWTPHQRYHITWAAGKLLALGINQVLLAFIPLRRRQRWSWFALTANFIFGGLSILVASRLQVGPLRPFHTHDRPTRLAVVAMVSTAVGLALAYLPLFRKRLVVPARFVDDAVRRD